MSGRRMSRRLAAAAIALTLAAGCAPWRPPVAVLPVEALHARYEKARAERERLGAGLAAQASVWAEFEEGTKLPGVQARLLVAAPAAFRLQVQSAFGTALDVAASGDSVTAYAPAVRLAWQTPSARDSMGIADPGRLGCRIWCASFDPPAEAWASAGPPVAEAAAAGDSPPSGTETAVQVVRWVEQGAALRMGVDAEARPAWIQVERDGGILVRARYRRWSSEPGVPWPVVIELDHPQRGLHATCRLQQVRAGPRPDPARLTVRIPDSVERVTGSSLRRLIQEVAGW